MDKHSTILADRDDFIIEWGFSFPSSVVHLLHVTVSTWCVKWKYNPQQSSAIEVQPLGFQVSTFSLFWAQNLHMYGDEPRHSLFAEIPGSRIKLSNGHLRGRKARMSYQRKLVLRASFWEFMRVMPASQPSKLVIDDAIIPQWWPPFNANPSTR